MTLYGLYAPRDTFWFPVASLVGLMSDLGTDNQVVRVAVSRLKTKGVLQPQTRNGVTGYALSDGYVPRLDANDSRIFDHPRGTAEEGWVLVGFSVPEQLRDKRHLLRSRLTELGYGTVSPGLWIAPARLHDDTVAMLDQFELSQYADIFHSHYGGRPDPKTKVAQWWDLDRLRGMYAEFIARHQPSRRRRPGNDQDAYVRHVHLVSEWRQLPFADPGLPLELLDEDWIGLRAQELFGRLQEELAERARDHVQAVVVTAVPSTRSRNAVISAR